MIKKKRKEEEQKKKKKKKKKKAKAKMSVSSTLRPSRTNVKTDSNLSGDSCHLIKGRRTTTKKKNKHEEEEKRRRKGPCKALTEAQSKS